MRMAKKILLVDDAAFMRKMIKDTLSKNGYTDLYEAVDERMRWKSTARSSRIW